MHRTANGDRVQRLAQAVRRQQRGVDAAREPADLVQRPIDLAAELGLERRRTGRVGGPELVHELELHPQRDQPLLGAIMEVALDPLPLDIGGGQDPCLGAAQLAHGGAELRVEPLLIEHQQRRRPGGVDELGALAERGIVHDRGDRLAIPVHARDRARGAEPVERDAVAIRVREAGPGAGTDAVGDLQRRIFERVGHCVAKLVGFGVDPETLH